MNGRRLFTTPEPGGFPLEAWAARNPRVRWPLVFALLLALLGVAGWVAPPDTALPGRGCATAPHASAPDTLETLDEDC